MFQFNKNILLALSFLVFCLGNAYAAALTCPPVSSIQITSLGNGTYTWKGPAVSGFVTGTTNPLAASKATGPSNAIKADYESSPLSVYDIVCYYPANATTKLSFLPPKTAYVFYRIYGAPKGYCKILGNQAICGGN